MNKIKLGFTALLLLFSICSLSAKKPIICNNKYALCSAAACQQIPGKKGIALCTCSIWHGKNIGYSNCQERKPIKSDYDQQQIISTFSLGGLHYLYMTCPAGIPWTSCLDQPCLVDKNHPRTAHCTCKIEEGTRYVTFAGDCDTKNCKKSMWSGAKIDDNQNFIKVIEQHLQQPIKHRKCKQ